MACRYEEEVFIKEKEVKECGCFNCPYKSKEGCYEVRFSNEKKENRR